VSIGRHGNCRFPTDGNLALLFSSEESSLKSPITKPRRKSVMIESNRSRGFLTRAHHFPSKKQNQAEKEGPNEAEENGFKSGSKTYLRFLQIPVSRAARCLSDHPGGPFMMGCRARSLDDHIRGALETKCYLALLREQDSSGAGQLSAWKSNVCDVALGRSESEFRRGERIANVGFTRE
jgi:hypothetical protein